MDPQETADVAESTLNFSKLSSVSEKKPEIPGYALGEKLGQGAFGAAYRATQERTGQSVAVKVLTRVGPRFREEVERLSLVSDHPHIVTLVDADLDHEPPYMVTPLLSGSLADQIPADPATVDIKKVCSWFQELAVALDYIHGRGILHSDIKPANVLIGEKGFVRLTDFGQATLQDQTKSKLGSFWYMPLAQTEGGVPQVRWDIYALGATVYALLTGQPPRSTPQARETLGSFSSISEKLEEYRRVLKTSRLRPVRELNPRVDPELAAIVEHCLDTDEGYSNAADILADLTRREEKRPLSARPLTFGYWLHRLVARHKLSFLVGMIAMVMLLTGLGVSTYEVYLARQARQALIQQQYERGLSLLSDGHTIGLVWLLRAYQLEQREEFRTALLDSLAKQQQIAKPSLYGLRTATAPSPSGQWAIWKDPDAHNKRKLIDLQTGKLSPLPPGLLGSDRDQKDKIRYRLDGIELDPFTGSGGPATWRMRSTDSLQPGEKNSGLAILIRPNTVQRVRRTDNGMKILDRDNGTVREISRPGQTPAQPTFSNLGDLALSWEDGKVEWHKPDGTVSIDSSFYGDIFCFSNDGKFLAACDGISRIRVWDREGRTVANFTVSAPANELCFGPDSKTLVCAGRNGLVWGFSLTEQRKAWPPIELEKAARWIYVQENGQVVTMSDVVIVWKAPEPLDRSRRSPLDLETEIARRTGWVYDARNTQIRMLTRDEYLEKFR